MYRSPTATQAQRVPYSIKLQQMMEAVDATPVTRKQKLLIYRAGICPRLTWPLLIEELPSIWMEREVDALATRYLKKWSGLTKSANTALLHLPQSKGGLNLQLPSALNKSLQVSHQSHLLTSKDHCVRHLAEKKLKQELACTRKKFRPATLVQQALIENPDHNRKSLSRAALISYSVCMCVVIPSDCAVIFVQHLDKLILDMITPAL